MEETKDVYRAMSLDALLSMAKDQLGLPSASEHLVPPAYINELRHHILLYPQDTNFRVTLEAMFGLGKVTCLEKGCNAVDIPLVTRFKASDGGKRDGLGSLSAYRNHISDNVAHEKSRLARLQCHALPDVKAEDVYCNNRVSSSPATSSPSGISLKREAPPSFASFPTPTKSKANSWSVASPAPIGAKRSVAAKKSFHLASVKPEPVESPMSWTSMTASKPQDLMLSRSSLPSSSKDFWRQAPPAASGSTFRVDSSPKFLGSSSPSSSSSPTIPRKRLSEAFDYRDYGDEFEHHRSISSFPSSSPLSENPRELAYTRYPLSAKRRKISNTCNPLPSLPAGGLTSSSTPVKKEATDQWNTSNHSTSTSTSPFDLPDNSSPQPYGNRSTLKSDPTSPTNTNSGLFGNRTIGTSVEDISDIRAKISSIQTEISASQINLDRLHRKKSKTKGDFTKMSNLMKQITSLREQKGAYNARIPSVSPVRRPMAKIPVTPTFPRNFEIKAEVKPIDFGSGRGFKQEAYVPSAKYSPPPFGKLVFKPVIPQQQTQPVASGSNVRLPTGCGDYVPPASRYKVPGAFPGDEDWAMGNLDDSADNHGHGPAIAQEIFQKIGVVIPNVLGMNAENFDSNGDFHGRGRDLFVGPQAKADDIDKFLLEAGNAEQFDGNASVEQALEKLGLASQYDLLPGMEVALMPHQTIGVAWMVEKEQSTLSGGCLGDDMGLGKTVQMMALIVKNQAKNPSCKTNLIIAPTALLDQWKFEIEMKTNCGLQVLIYHGSSRPRRKKDLLAYDVVLTTFATMALEWPDHEAEQKKAKAKRKRSANDFVVSDSDDDRNGNSGKKSKKELGLLFQIDWYRVILDEAQAVRNRRTRTSRAVTDLRAIYRWCLTGTPIINSLVDVYGYLRFLKIRPWYDFTEFQSKIGVLEKKNPALAVSRLQAVITMFLLRRMKDSMLDGKRLIELPNKIVTLVKLEFTQEEKEIYQMVEAKTQAKFNRYLRAGTVLKNYSQVLVLLLRLRQICSHPSLIQEDGVAFVGPEEVDNEKPELSNELTRAKRLVSQEFVDKVKHRLKDSALRRLAAEKESADAAVDDEECPICFDALTKAVITPCTHVFCRECLVDVLNTPLIEVPNEPARFQPNERPCPACRSPICAEKLFERSAFEPSDADLAEKGPDSDVEMADSTNARTMEHKGKGKGKVNKVNKRKRALPLRIMDSDDITPSDAETEDSNDEDDDDMSDFIVESDEDEEEKDARRILKKRLGKRAEPILIEDSDDEIDDSPEDKEILFGVKAKKALISSDAIKLMPRFLPSTKMKYMMQHLRELVEERPDEKTMVVSQWTGCLSLVSDYLTEAGVVHVKYQGDMNRIKRDLAVRAFMSKDKARVMLMSLKCGGVGLNLTRANNVISLDLGWSQAIEAQAFDRVHRLGQTRPVVVQRLVIADTVEDRVLAMQERKQALADGSLGEGKGKKIGRLSVKELAQLFGLDHHGRVLTH